MQQCRRVPHEQRAALVLGEFAFAFVDFHPINPMSPVVWVVVWARANLEWLWLHARSPLASSPPTRQGRRLAEPEPTPREAKQRALQRIAVGRYPTGLFIVWC